MAAELDCHKRSPLHLGSAEGHSEIVRALLEANTDVCFVRDQEGRIPLHLAAMRGRVEVIEELMNAKLDSVAVKFDGDTALHLCVKYSHLDALKLMIKKINYDDQLINLRNQDGKTILHLAAMLKQFEAVNYMLSFSLYGEPEITTLNSATTSLNIQEILKEAPGERTNYLRADVVEPVLEPDSAAAAPWFKTFKKYCSYQSNRLEEIGGSLMVAAPLIARVSFQDTVRPPLLADANPVAYKNFMAINAASLVSSLSVILLIVTGVPFRNKLLTWMMLSMFASLIWMMIIKLMYDGRP